MDCKHCNGGGKITVACNTCLGVGEMLREVKETIAIPKGIDTGDNSVLESKGNLKLNKKDRGDLTI